MVDANILVNLRPNRDLMDPYFDRYILVNKKFPMKKIQLPQKVSFKTPSNEQFSYQHIKTFSFAQRLVFDQFIDNHSFCYTILQNGIINGTIFSSENFDFLESNKVAQLETFEKISDDNTYQANLLFVDCNYSIVSDGFGTIRIFATGNRRFLNPWTLVFQSNQFPPCIIADVKQKTVAGLSNENSIWTVDVLLQTVESKKTDDLVKTQFSTLLIWLTITKKSCESFEITRRRELSCCGHVEFATFDTNLQQIFIVSSTNSMFIFDSLLPITADQSDTMTEELTNKAIVKDETKQEADCNLADSNLIKNSLVTEDTSPLFNSEQLEECDRSLESVYGFVIDGNSHKTNKIIDLTGSQILFTTRLSAGRSLAFALRNDVDALVWNFEEQKKPEDELLSHKYTLHAFGYIQAGHNEKEFTGCSPSGDYAVIVNRRNHVFIFFQNAVVDKDFELKNRKTGAIKSTVAEQIIFALSQVDENYNINEPDGEYIGFHAANDVIFLLTHNAIIALNIKEKI